MKGLRRSAADIRAEALEDAARWVIAMIPHAGAGERHLVEAAAMIRARAADPGEGIGRAIEALFDHMKREGLLHE